MWLGTILAIGLALFKTSVHGVALNQPRDLKVLDIRSRNLIISWDEPLDSENHTILYDIFYKGDDKDWKEVNNVTGKVATLIVKPDTRYEVFVVAKVDKSYGVASAHLHTNNTLPEAPSKCPSITNTERTGSTVDVIWEEIRKEDRNGKLLGHVIYYKNCSMNETLTRKVDISHSSDVGTIDNLGPGPYGFRVVAYNSEGNCTDTEIQSLISENYFTDTNKYLKNQCLSLTPRPTTPKAITTTAPATTDPTTSAPTTTAPTTTAPTTTAPTTTAPTTTAPTTTAPTTTAPTTTAPTTAKLPTTTEKPEPTKPQPCSCPNTKEPVEPTDKEAETLANTKDNNWLKYVAIALAVIVVIMGITIFMLIWQLYKNHRFYKLSRQQNYKMSSRQDHIGHDNQAQDNP